MTAAARRAPTRTARIDYAAWADFRYEIRKWMRLSENAAAQYDIPAQHHQILLAIKGYRGLTAPSISDLAERMQLRHHSVVGLLDRMELEGLVMRQPTGVGRTTAVLLTEEGEALLEDISELLRPDLQSAAARLVQALAALSNGHSTTARRGVEARNTIRARTSRAGTRLAVTAPASRSSRST